MDNSKVPKMDSKRSRVIYSDDDSNLQDRGPTANLKRLLGGGVPLASFAAGGTRLPSTGTGTRASRPSICLFGVVRESQLGSAVGSERGRGLSRFIPPRCLPRPSPAAPIDSTTTGISPPLAVVTTAPEVRLPSGDERNNIYHFGRSKSQNTKTHTHPEPPLAAHGQPGGSCGPRLSADENGHPPATPAGRGAVASTAVRKSLSPLFARAKIAKQVERGGAPKAATAAAAALQGSVSKPIAAFAPPAALSMSVANSIFQRRKLAGVSKSFVQANVEPPRVTKQPPVTEAVGAPGIGAPVRSLKGSGKTVNTGDVRSGGRGSMRDERVKNRRRHVILSHESSADASSSCFDGHDSESSSDKQRSSGKAVKQEPRVAGRRHGLKSFLAGTRTREKGNMVVERGVLTLTSDGRPGSRANRGSEDERGSTGPDASFSEDVPLAKRGRGRPKGSTTARILMQRMHLKNSERASRASFRLQQRPQRQQGTREKKKEETPETFRVLPGASGGNFEEEDNLSEGYLEPVVSDGGDEDEGVKVAEDASESSINRESRRHDDCLSQFDSPGSFGDTNESLDEGTATATAAAAAAAALALTVSSLPELNATKHSHCEAWAPVSGMSVSMRSGPTTEPTGREVAPPIQPCGIAIPIVEPDTDIRKKADEAPAAEWATAEWTAVTCQEMNQPCFSLRKEKESTPAPNPLDAALCLHPSRPQDALATEGCDQCLTDFASSTGENLVLKTPKEDLSPVPGFSSADVNWQSPEQRNAEPSSSRRFEYQLGATQRSAAYDNLADDTVPLRQNELQGRTTSLVVGLVARAAEKRTGHHSSDSVIEATALSQPGVDFMDWSPAAGQSPRRPSRRSADQRVTYRLDEGDGARSVPVPDSISTAAPPAAFHVGMSRILPLTAMGAKGFQSLALSSPNADSVVFQYDPLPSGARHFYLAATGQLWNGNSSTCLFPKSRYSGTGGGGGGGGSCKPKLKTKPKIKSKLESRPKAKGKRGSSPAVLESKPPAAGSFDDDDNEGINSSDDGDWKGSGANASNNKRDSVKDAKHTGKGKGKGKAKGTGGGGSDAGAGERAESVEEEIIFFPAVPSPAADATFSVPHLRMRSPKGFKLLDYAGMERLRRERGAGLSEAALGALVSAMSPTLACHKCQMPHFALRCQWCGVVSFCEDCHRRYHADLSSRDMWECCPKCRDACSCSRCGSWHVVNRWLDKPPAYGLPQQEAFARHKLSYIGPLLKRHLAVEEMVVASQGLGRRLDVIPAADISARNIVQCNLCASSIACVYGHCSRCGWDICPLCLAEQLVREYALPYLTAPNGHTAAPGSDSDATAAAGEDPDTLPAVAGVGTDATMRRCLREGVRAVESLARAVHALMAPSPLFAEPGGSNGCSLRLPRKCPPGGKVVQGQRLPSEYMTPMHLFLSNSFGLPRSFRPPPIASPQPAYPLFCPKCCFTKLVRHPSQVQASTVAPWTLHDVSIASSVNESRGGDGNGTSRHEQGIVGKVQMDPKTSGHNGEGGEGGDGVKCGVVSNIIVVSQGTPRCGSSGGATPPPTSTKEAEEKMEGGPEGPCSVLWADETTPPGGATAAAPPPRRNSSGGGGAAALAYPTTLRLSRLVPDAMLNVLLRVCEEYGDCCDPPPIPPVLLFRDSAEGREAELRAKEISICWDDDKEAVNGLAPGASLDGEREEPRMRNGSALDLNLKRQTGSPPPACNPVASREEAVPLGGKESGESAPVESRVEGTDEVERPSRKEGSGEEEEEDDALRDKARGNGSEEGNGVPFGIQEARGAVGEELDGGLDIAQSNGTQEEEQGERDREGEESFLILAWGRHRLRREDVRLASRRSEEKRYIFTPHLRDLQASSPRALRYHLILQERWALHEPVIVRGATHDPAIWTPEALEAAVTRSLKMVDDMKCLRNECAAKQIRAAGKGARKANQAALQRRRRRRRGSDDGDDDDDDDVEDDSDWESLSKSSSSRRKAPPLALPPLQSTAKELVPPVYISARGENPSKRPTASRRSPNPRIPVAAAEEVEVGESERPRTQRRRLPSMPPPPPLGESPASAEGGSRGAGGQVHKAGVVRLSGEEQKEVADGKGTEEEEEDGRGMAMGRGRGRGSGRRSKSNTPPLIRLGGEADKEAPSARDGFVSSLGGAEETAGDGEEGRRSPALSKRRRLGCTPTPEERGTPPVPDVGGEAERDSLDAEAGRRGKTREEAKGRKRETGLEPSIPSLPLEEEVAGGVASFRARRRGKSPAEQDRRTAPSEERRSGPRAEDRLTDCQTPRPPGPGHRSPENIEDKIGAVSTDVDGEPALPRDPDSVLGSRRGARVREKTEKFRAGSPAELGLVKSRRSASPSSFSGGGGRSKSPAAVVVATRASVDQETEKRGAKFSARSAASVSLVDGGDAFASSRFLKGELKRRKGTDGGSELGLQMEASVTCFNLNGSSRATQERGEAVIDEDGEAQGVTGDCSMGAGVGLPEEALAQSLNYAKRLRGDRPNLHADRKAPPPFAPVASATRGLASGLAQMSGSLHSRGVSEARDSEAASERRSYRTDAGWLRPSSPSPPVVRPKQEEAHDGACGWKTEDAESLGSFIRKLPRDGAADGDGSADVSDGRPGDEEAAQGHATREGTPRSGGESRRRVTRSAFCEGAKEKVEKISEDMHVTAAPSDDDDDDDAEDEDHGRNGGGGGEPEDRREKSAASDELAGERAPREEGEERSRAPVVHEDRAKSREFPMDSSRVAAAAVCRLVSRKKLSTSIVPRPLSDSLKNNRAAGRGPPPPPPPNLERSAEGASTQPPPPLAATGSGGDGDGICGVTAATPPPLPPPAIGRRASPAAASSVFVFPTDSGLVPFAPAAVERTLSSSPRSPASVSVVSTEDKDRERERERERARLGYGQGDFKHDDVEGDLAALSIIDCAAGWEEVPGGMTQSRFFRAYRQGYRPPLQPQMLKLKDYPPRSDFRKTLVELFFEFQQCLPLPWVLCPDPASSPLNLATLTLPGSCPTDLGPKAYMALGTKKEYDFSYDVIDPNPMARCICCGAGAGTGTGGEGEEKEEEAFEKEKELKKKERETERQRLRQRYLDDVNSVTKLHVDMADAVNVTVHVASSGSGEEDEADEGRPLRLHGDKGPCRARCGEEPLPCVHSGYNGAGSVWDIYDPSQQQALRRYLWRHRGRFSHAARNVREVEVLDPIFDQCFMLTERHRRRLWLEERVEGWHVEQLLHEAVLLPAGCPHQVRNVRSCTKVAVDFVSPQGLSLALDTSLAQRAVPYAFSPTDREQVTSPYAEKLQAVLIMMSGAVSSYRVLHPGVLHPPEREEPGPKPAAAAAAGGRGTKKRGRGATHPEALAKTSLNAPSSSLNVPRAREGERKTEEE